MPPVKVLYVAPGTGGFFGFGTDLGIISYSKLILLYYKSFRLSRTEIRCRNFKASPAAKILKTENQTA